MADVNVGRLLWSIDAKTDKIDKSLKTTETKLTKFGKTVVAAFSVAAVAAFAKAAADVAIKLVGLASDAEETANKFNVVFAGMEEAAEAAENLAENYGISSEASQRLLSDTADLLQGFGVQKDESLALSLATQELAADLASFSNKDPEEASRALTSALLGEREAVKQLGIAITDAELTRFAAEQGQVFKEMSKAEVAVLTLELAYKQSANAIGDFERSQDSFSNQLKIARANVADLGASIGEDLIPAATKGVTKFNELIEALIETRAKTEDVVEASGAVAAGTATAEQRVLEYKRQLDALNVSYERSAELGYANVDVYNSQKQSIETLINAAERQAAAESRGAREAEIAAIQAEEAVVAAEKQLELDAERLELEKAAAAAALEAEEIRLEAIANLQIAEEENIAYITELRGEQALAKAEAEATELAAEKLRHDEKIQHLRDEMSFYSSYAGNVASIFSNLIQLQIAGDDEMTEEKKKNIIALYRIQQAANIAQVIMDTASAIMKGYADLGPIFGTVSAVVLGALGVAQIAVIAATPPPLQDGGIIPASPGGSTFIAGEAGQSEAVIPLDDEGGFGQVRLTVNLDGQALIDFTQSALNNRDIIVDAGSVS